jgi:hypothetical protein
MWHRYTYVESGKPNTLQSSQKERESMKPGFRFIAHVLSLKSYLSEALLVLYRPTRLPRDLKTYNVLMNKQSKMEEQTRGQVRLTAGRHPNSAGFGYHMGFEVKKSLLFEHGANSGFTDRFSS